jgi:hypothetical protein
MKIILNPNQNLLQNKINNINKKKKKNLIQTNFLLKNK